MFARCSFVFALLITLTNFALANEHKAAEPFNGKDLHGWKTKTPAERSKWGVGQATLDPSDAKKIKFVKEGGDMVNVEGGGVDIYSDAKFGDCLIEIEVFVPKGSNSGIYVMGEYEVQVFDSFGKPADKMGTGDMGAIYSAAKPTKNPIRAPGQWNKYVIDFRAPRFNDKGERTAKAKFVKVQLNGELLHENIEMNGPTPGGITGKEAPTGPIMFQGDHGPIAFRNIRITPVK
ncbi:MAG: DUF1080 domain-containing protein [Phycisphaeraceae bacterium]